MKKEFIKVTMGIDVSKDKLDVCIMGMNEDFSTKVVATRSFNNTVSGIQLLFDYWIPKSNALYNSFVVLEPTGTYHENMVYFLHEKGVNVCIELANKIKHFAKSLNVKTKTDKKDSMLIARYGLQNDVTFWKPASEKELSLKQLTRLRQIVNKDLTMSKNRLHALKATDKTLESIRTYVKDQIEFSSKLLQDIEKDLAKLVKEDDVLRKKIEILTSIPGIGLITAATVIAETGGFQTFNSARSLVSYAGLDVAHKESGTSLKKSEISKRGNARLRTGLYMAALTAFWKAPTLAPTYERIKDSSGIKQKGVIAVMRKLLILMYTLWKSEEMYDSEYIHQSVRVIEEIK